MIDYPSTSTGAAVRGCIADANDAMAPWAGEMATNAAATLRTMPNEEWRSGYPEHCVRHHELLASSGAACVAGARAGLASLYSTFQFNGTTLREGLKQPSKGEPFSTETLHGESVEPAPDVTLPLGGVTLDGDSTMAKLRAWADAGVVEPDVVTAVKGVRGRGCDLTSSEWVFVVLGAGAAMGPLETLLSLGAHVLAVDLPIPAVWERLMATAKASRGTLSFPVSAASEGADVCTRAGCNLLEDAPRIRDWLLRQCPEKRLCIGSYAYLDSADFVRVSVAMDAIASDVLEARPNSALAYLCSPTDVFAIPASSRARAQWNYSTGKSSSSALALARAAMPSLRPGAFKANAAGANPRLPLVDSLVLQQGPNYFFAKRLQHWRALAARADGCVVSSNVAPASNTRSVLKNPLLAAAFGGADFVDLHIFEPDTSNVLMTYLLLHDLHVQGSSVNHLCDTPMRPLDCQLSLPAAVPSPLNDDAHPLMLFATTAVHNGVWTSGFQLRSVVEAVVLSQYTKSAVPHVIAAAVAFLGGIHAIGGGPALKARL